MVDGMDDEGESKRWNSGDGRIFALHEGTNLLGISNRFLRDKFLSVHAVGVGFSRGEDAQSVSSVDEWRVLVEQGV